MDWLGTYRGGVSPFTDLWDPFYNNWNLARRGTDLDDVTSSLAHARVDWLETPTAHIFRADLPGVRKEDLKVEVEENKILQISGERVKEKEDQNDKWHRLERQSGSFLRRFRLPEDADARQIGCSLANGVLTVTVPKAETKPESKNVRLINVA